jgi:ABC-type antimicrobial peptide transport system permease subunit
MNRLMIPRLALKALRQHALRTGLTMLGIIIGVGAVICVVAIGEGAQCRSCTAIRTGTRRFAAIMLVSVTERTREIGLRQAVGARGRDVRRQFLVEAVILSLIGGAIGIGLGMFGARMIADAFQWPTRVSSNAVALAFGCSAAIGVFFRYYPARQAANLDPIEALRFE